MDLQAVDRIIESYGRDPSQLLAVLQDIQGEANWLPPEALARVGEAMGIPVARIYRLATFFHAFSLKPRGKHVCTVCMGTACHVRGAPRLVEKLERDLGIEAGETTADREFTLETVNCVGACALGPLVIVDGDYHGNMTSAGLEKLMKGHRKPATASSSAAAAPAGAPAAVPAAPAAPKAPVRSGGGGNGKTTARESAAMAARDALETFTAEETTAAATAPRPAKRRKVVAAARKKPSGTVRAAAPAAKKRKAAVAAAAASKPKAALKRKAQARLATKAKGKIAAAVRVAAKPTAAPARKAAAAPSGMASKGKKTHAARLKVKASPNDILSLAIAKVMGSREWKKLGPKAKSAGRAKTGSKSKRGR